MLMDDLAVRMEKGEALRQEAFHKQAAKKANALAAAYSQDSNFIDSLSAHNSFRSNSVHFDVHTNNLAFFRAQTCKEFFCTLAHQSKQAPTLPCTPYPTNPLVPYKPYPTLYLYPPDPITDLCCLTGVCISQKSEHKLGIPFSLK